MEHVHVDVCLHYTHCTFCYNHSTCTFQVSKRGRLGARSKYVDVLNPGGTSAASDSQPPPPGPPLMAAMMSGSNAQPFTGTFFVPQQAPGVYCVCICSRKRGCVGWCVMYM